MVIPWGDAQAGNPTDGGGTPHPAAGNIRALTPIVVGQFPNVVPSPLDKESTPVVQPEGGNVRLYVLLFPMSSVLTAGIILDVV
jgi:hypothetical protein